ncbi:hypothetical protein [Mesorhizobium sp. M0088]|uniref:hypothetical protein n=1 Tax=Mesorhizobium sp. M0088 TaxID=2956873 RepID=UPI003335DFFD
MTGLRRPSSACRHLLPVNGEKKAGRNLGDPLAIGENGGASVLLPVTIRGVEEWSAQRTKSQLLGFSNDERSGRAMRGGADIRKASFQ